MDRHYGDRHDPALDDDDSTKYQDRERTTWKIRNPTTVVDQEEELENE